MQNFVSYEVLYAKQRRYVLTHTIGTIDFGQLHTAHDKTRHYLTGTLDNCILGGVPFQVSILSSSKEGTRLFSHVETTHAPELLELLHADEALDGESTKRTVMASSGDDDGGIDGVRIHARLIIMMHGYQRPVGDNTGDADTAIRKMTRDEILDSSCIEELDIGKLKDLGQDGRREERGMLHNDVVTLIFVGNTNLTEESIRWLTHDHSREELATEPSATACTTSATLMTHPKNRGVIPGETLASMMVICRSGLALPSMYAVLRPQEPAPTMTISVSAWLFRSWK